MPFRLGPPRGLRPQLRLLLWGQHSIVTQLTLEFIITHATLPSWRPLWRLTRS